MCKLLLQGDCPNTFDKPSSKIIFQICIACSEVIVHSWMIIINSNVNFILYLNLEFWEIILYIVYVGWDWTTFWIDVMYRFSLSFFHVERQNQRQSISTFCLCILNVPVRKYARLWLASFDSVSLSLLLIRNKHWWG